MDPIPWEPNDKERTKERDSKLYGLMRSSYNQLKDSKFISEFFKQFEELKLDERYHGKKMKVILYGLGNLENEEYDIDSRLQLSLVMTMQQKCKWIKDIEVFDPVLSETEVAFISRINFRVMRFNEMCMRKVDDEPVLFYTPYCAGRLYNNLLMANWKPESLHNIVLLGTSLKSRVLEFKNPLNGEEKEEDDNEDSEYEDDDYDEEFEKEWSKKKPSSPDKPETVRHVAAVEPYIQKYRIPFFMEDNFWAFDRTSWHIFKVNEDTHLPLTD